jgi:type I restriction enzyme S subunit
VSFPRYERYKDSGVQWLGEVPEHWEVQRLRFVAAINPSRDELGAIPSHTKVSFVPMDSIQEIGPPLTEFERTINEVLTGYTYFRDGDVAIAKITPCFENGKRALFSNLTNGIGFGTTELIVLRAHVAKSSAKFLYWLCAAPTFMKPAEGSMYGTGGQKRVSDDFVRNYLAAMPPVH